MPSYGFECYEDDGGCGMQFDIICSWDDIEGKAPKCPNCNKKKAVSRNFSGNVIVFDASAKTVGALAERNGSRMSADEIHHIQTHNRLSKPKFSGSLPTGGSLKPVDSQGRMIPDTKKGKDLGRVSNG